MNPKQMKTFFLLVALSASPMAISDEGEEDCEQNTSLDTKEMQKIINAVPQSCAKGKYLQPKCGLKGTIKERIANCKKIDKEKIPGLVLVSRNGDGNYCNPVYMESKTGYLISDFATDGMYTNMSHESALKACDKLSQSKTGGIKGKWRLPTKEELGANYVDSKKGSPTKGQVIDQSARRETLLSLPGMKGSHLWTSDYGVDYIASKPKKNLNKVYFFDGSNKNKADKKKYEADIKLADKSQSELKVRCVMKP